MAQFRITNHEWALNWTTRVARESEGAARLIEGLATKGGRVQSLRPFSAPAVQRKKAQEPREKTPDVLMTNGGTWCANLHDYQEAEVLEAMTKSELRYILSSASVWSPEPLGSLPKPQLVGLIRRNEYARKLLRQYCVDPSMGSPGTDRMFLHGKPKPKPKKGGKAPPVAGLYRPASGVPRTPLWRHPREGSVIGFKSNAERSETPPCYSLPNSSLTMANHVRGSWKQVQTLRRSLKASRPPAWHAEPQVQKGSESGKREAKEEAPERLGSSRQAMEVVGGGVLQGRQIKGGGAKGKGEAVGVGGSDDGVKQAVGSGKIGGKEEAKTLKRGIAEMQRRLEAAERNASQGGKQREGEAKASAGQGDAEAKGSSQAKHREGKGAEHAPPGPSQAQPSATPPPLPSRPSSAGRVAGLGEAAAQKAPVRPFSAGGLVGLRGNKGGLVRPKSAENVTLGEKKGGSRPASAGGMVGLGDEEGMGVERVVGSKERPATAGGSGGKDRTGVLGLSVGQGGTGGLATGKAKSRIMEDVRNTRDELSRTMTSDDHELKIWLRGRGAGMVFMV